MIELNDVLLEGVDHTVSFMAPEGLMTCVTGATPALRSRLLYGILGFVPVKSGFISLDGEPLTPATATDLRRMMAYAPSRLQAEGQIRRFDPPSVQDVFDLKGNQDILITSGALNRQMKQVGQVSEEQARWLVVAVLRNKPVLLADHPEDGAADYLLAQARQGRIVIVTSPSPVYCSKADRVVSLDTDSYYNKV